MEGELNIDRRGGVAAPKPRRSSLAFIVEALILLLFLIGSLAVVVQLFSLSANKATQGKHLEQAVVAAANVAERFSANPKSVEENSTVGSLAVKCQVEETKLAHGVKYDATIIVFDENGEVYRLNTSRYAPTAYAMVTQSLNESTLSSNAAGSASGAGAANSTSTPDAPGIKNAAPNGTQSSASTPGAVTEVIE